MSGIQTEATTDTGGGSNIGYTDGGDWIAYDNTTVDIPTTGQYILSYRVASQDGGGSFSVYETGTNVVYGGYSLRR
jgi:endoglucanase